MSDDLLDSVQLRMRVNPEPDPATMVAIVAAVRARRQRQTGIQEVSEEPQRTGRWGRAGRREAMADREIVDANESRQW